MRRARLALLVPLALLGTLVAMPGGALAADPAPVTVTVTGTVVRDGQPVVGASVSAHVTSGDTAGSATTDEGGRFTIGLEATPGNELVIDARGQTFQSDPDEHGCVNYETLTGRASMVLDEVPPAPVEVVLDQLLTSKVCPTATATPRLTPPSTATPRLTPPSTDAPAAPRPGSTPGGGLLVVLGVLAMAGTGSIVLAGRRG